MDAQRRRHLLESTHVGRLALTDEPAHTDGAARFAAGADAAPVHTESVLAALSPADYVDASGARWPVCTNRAHAARDLEHAAREIGERLHSGAISRAVAAHLAANLRRLAQQRGLPVPPSLGTR